MRSPLPHQRPVIEWAKGRERIGLLLEMRLGKTHVTNQWLAQLPRKSRALIVAPKYVLPVWVAEGVADGLDMHLLEGSIRNREEQFRTLPRTAICLTNWEALRASTVLREYPWETVVLDESLRMANPKSQTTQALWKIQPKYRAILTGEIFPDDLKQVFCQLRWLHGEFMGEINWWRWRARYFNQYGYEWVPRKGVVELIRQELRDHCYVLRLRDAGLSTKKTIYVRRYCSLPLYVRKLYRRLEETFMLGDASTKWTPVVRLWTSQICGGCFPQDFNSEKLYRSPHKYEVLRDLLLTELRNKKVVVYFRFNREIEYVRRNLDRLGLQTEAITGSTPASRRATAGYRLACGKGKDRVDILLCQGSAIKYGLDFSAAHAAIFFSNWWSWNVRSQLEARLRHPKRRSAPLVVDIVCADTVDVSLVRALRNRKHNSESLLDAVRREYLEGGMR